MPLKTLMSDFKMCLILKVFYTFKEIKFNIRAIKWVKINER